MKITKDIPEKSRLMVYKRENYHCARCGTPTAIGEWHHRRGRAVRDEHTHCPCNGLYLCHTCHVWVTEHPFEARSTGLIVSRFAIPGDTPWLRWDKAWVLPDHEGKAETTDAIDLNEAIENFQAQPR